MVPRILDRVLQRLLDFKTTIGFIIDIDHSSYLYSTQIFSNYAIKWQNQEESLVLVQLTVLLNSNLEVYALALNAERRRSDDTRCSIWILDW